MNDPLYHAIVQALQGPPPLRPDVFEHCAQDLLRRGPYPTLSPVKGGSDAGVDALVDDGQGEGRPVVITSDRRPIRNLIRSLDAQLKAGNQSRQLILATSTALTPQQQRNLRSKAGQKGYQLGPIFEQAWFADQLYWDPTWRKRLLDLSGAPPALSAVPASRRPSFHIDPVGRDADLEWLRAIHGHSVLIGQPGCGKSFLLRHLAAEGRALFLATKDAAAIADGLRAQRPKIVIVDDAHVDPSDLVRLRQLGEQIRAEFSILAVTWPGSRDEVIEALGGVAGDRIHTLELLTRDEIVEIYRRVGLGSLDPGAMRELVDQAANKPGLAVTLAGLILQGAGVEVLTGEAVRRNLVTALLPLVGEDIPEILACFALGGEKGLAIESVASFLQLRPGEILRKASALASAGVLTEKRNNVLAVVPSALRAALLGESFFPDSGPRLTATDLLRQVPDLSSATLGLIEAAGRGTAVPRELIQHSILRVEEETALQLAKLRSHEGIDEEIAARVAEHHRETWRAYASLGPLEAQWVLRRYPGGMIAIGHEILWTIPEVAIHRLLEQAASGGGDKSYRERTPFGVLSAWIHELPIHRTQRTEPIRRRRLLAFGARQFLAAGGDHRVASRAILLALSPSLGGTSSDPGSGRRFTISRRLLGLADLREIERIWREVRGLVSIDDEKTWTQLKATLWPLVHAEALLQGTSCGERETLMRSFGRQVLADLAPLGSGSPGLAAGLRRLGRQVGVELSTPLDTAFEVLYPAAFDGDGFRKQEEEARRTARSLARAWVSEGPEIVADRLAGYEGEAKRIGQKWPRMTMEFCSQLAELAEDPGSWWRAIQARDPGTDTTWPFLRAACERKPPGWTDVPREALGSGRDRSLAAELVLRLDSPPSDLWDLALGVAADDPQLVETAALRAGLPIANAARLLRNEDWRIALAAALGEWHAEPAGSVREELAEPWRDAILRAPLVEEDRAWVGAADTLIEILGNDPGLGEAWLRARIRGSDLPERLLVSNDVLRAAVRPLARDQRSRLLDDLPPAAVLRDLLPVLIGNDQTLFRRLLAIDGLRRYHLEALQGRPDEVWAEKARLALDAGHEIEDVALAAVGWYWEDSAANWQHWESAFAEIENHPDSRIEQVAERGKAFAREMLTRSAARDRELELTGL